MESPDLMTYAVEFSIGVTESLSAYLVAVRLFRTIAFIVLPRLGCLLSLLLVLLVYLVFSTSNLHCYGIAVALRWFY